MNLEEAKKIYDVNKLGEIDYELPFVVRLGIAKGIVEGHAAGRKEAEGLVAVLNKIASEDEAPTQYRHGGFIYNEGRRNGETSVKHWHAIDAKQALSEWEKGAKP